MVVVNRALCGLYEEVLASMYDAYKRFLKSCEELVLEMARKTARQHPDAAIASNVGRDVVDKFHGRARQFYGQLMLRVAVADDNRASAAEVLLEPKCANEIDFQYESTQLVSKLRPCLFECQDVERHAATDLGCFQVELADELRLSQEPLAQWRASRLRVLWHGTDASLSSWCKARDSSVTAESVDNAVAESANNAAPKSAGPFAVFHRAGA